MSEVFMRLGTLVFRSRHGALQTIRLTKWANMVRPYCSLMCKSVITDLTVDLGIQLVYASRNRS